MKKAPVILIGTIVLIAMVGLSNAFNRPTPEAESKKESENPKDRQAIEKQSQAFVKAFNNGDAKAVASFWTSQGEYHGESGEIIQGRAAIEETYTRFFKENPKCQLEIITQSIRFPSPTTAIEEGVLRVKRADPTELPSSTVYGTMLVKEKDQWKIAVSWESGAEQDRLEDLQWLLGTWSGKVKDSVVTVHFEWDRKKPFIMAQLTTKTDGKIVSSGTKKIGIDPETGQLRSWHFDDNGGHGQSLWIRDGNNWVLDSRGVLANGSTTWSVDLLSRINDNTILWRSVDRVVDEEPVPDTIPVKLTRARKP